MHSDITLPSSIRIDQFVLELLRAGVHSFFTIFVIAGAHGYCQTWQGAEVFRAALEHYGFTILGDCVSLRDSPLDTGL